MSAGILGPGDRVELLEGEIIEMSPEKSRHAASVDLALDALRRVLPAGYSIRVQHPLALSDSSEPEPDLAVVRGTPRDYVDGHPSSAEMVLEVADSSLEYDRTRKASVYAAAAIAEYWIVNLVDAVVEVHREPTRSGYRSVDTRRAADVLRPLAAPGAEIRVAELLP